MIPWRIVAEHVASMQEGDQDIYIYICIYSKS